MSHAPVYDTIGRSYPATRRPDPRIAAVIRSALAPARSVLNVGAGSGSYEPGDLPVIALEPSAAMIRHRPPASAPAIQGRAECIPARDDSFDAALAVLTLHHWSDPGLGLSECVRVARDRIVLLTWDPAADGFWLVQEYLPEFLELDRRQFPAMREIQAWLGEKVRIEVHPLAIPRDCHDGFLGAFWARPHCYLDPAVRSGISSFARVPTGHGLDRLRDDLESGAWAARHRALLERESLDVGYRIVIAELA